jgi:transcriptional regulator GlxA family with amidase domain
MQEFRVNGLPGWLPEPAAPLPAHLEDLLSPELRACVAFHRRVKSALEFGLRDPARTVSLREVADHVGMEKTAFCRYFKMKVGIPYVTAIRILRIRYAATLLRTNDYSVCEIASLSGFENRATFGRSFRTHCGMSPSEYRVRNEPAPNAASLSVFGRSADDSVAS